MALRLHGVAAGLRLLTAAVGQLAAAPVVRPIRQFFQSQSLETPEQELAMQTFVAHLSDEYWERVASFSRYQDAERAVDFLADQKFPVEQTSIVAAELRYVERVTGRLNWFRAAAYNAGGGLLVGTFLGFFLGLLHIVRPFVSSLVLAVYGGFMGLVFGAILGLISYALSGGKRDFTTLSGLDAASYDIMVQTDKAAEARKILQQQFGHLTTSPRRSVS